MAKTETRVSTKVSDETMEALKNSYPVEQGFVRSFLPRIGMYSQDVEEGKGKGKKVTTEAGTFYIERQSDEEDENGKKIWKRQEIGDSFKGIIVYQRKQLRMYDEKTEEYTSSPVYDSDEEIVPIFCNKAEVGRDTPRNLKAKYQYTDANGKVKSKLEDNRILYILYEDDENDSDIYQMNLRGSSMFSFLTFARKNLPPSLLVEFSSEPMEKGQISWNKMTFTPVSSLSEKEIKNVLAKVSEIKDGINQEKSFFSAKAGESDAANKEFDSIPGKKVTKKNIPY